VPSAWSACLPPLFGQYGEGLRLNKIRFVDLLEGKLARFLAILLLIGIVLLLAFAMSQTA
jgi:hypothetical protein